MLTVHFHLHDRLSDAEMQSVLGNLTAHIQEERKAQIPGFDKLMGSWEAKQTSDSEDKPAAHASAETPYDTDYINPRAGPAGAA